MPPAEIQNAFEAELAVVIDRLAGRGSDEDWALVRALVHKAVHLAADRRRDYCAISVLFAEMTQHAHAVMHEGPDGHGPAMH